MFGFMFTEIERSKVVKQVSGYGMELQMELANAACSVLALYVVELEAALDEAKCSSKVQKTIRKVTLILSIWERFRLGKQGTSCISRGGYGEEEEEDMSGELIDSRVRRKTNTWCRKEGLSLRYREGAARLCGQFLRCWEESHGG